MFECTSQELKQTNQQLEETSVVLNATQAKLAQSQQSLKQTKVEKRQKEFLVQQHMKTEQILLDEAGKVHTKNNATKYFMFYCDTGICYFFVYMTRC